MTTLSLRDRQSAWRLFMAGDTPETIAAKLNQPLRKIIEATSDRERSIVTIFKATRHVGQTARATAASKATVCAVLDKNGLDHKAPPPPQKSRSPKVVIEPVALTEAPKNAKDFFALEPDECRYPYGERAPFKFCAELTDNDVYCPHHRKLCSTPPKTEVFVSEKQAA